MACIRETRDARNVGRSFRNPPRQSRFVMAILCLHGRAPLQGFHQIWHQPRGARFIRTDMEAKPPWSLRAHANTAPRGGSPDSKGQGTAIALVEMDWPPGKESNDCLILLGSSAGFSLPYLSLSNLNRASASFSNPLFFLGHRVQHTQQERMAYGTID